MFTRLRAIAASCVIAASSFMTAANAYAADYPEKPIRMVVPMAAGGGGDIIARMIGQKLTETWGQPVIVDNRGGGGGSIAPDMVAKAPADAYTLLLISLSNVLNTALYPTLPYDIVKDFAPITQINQQPNILVVPPSFPAKSVKELIALAKEKPGQINYASDGKGSYTHVTMEMFKNMAGIDMVHIPYKGSAPSIIDMLAGRVDVKLAGIIAVLTHVRSGKLRALGVTSRNRVAAAESIPPIQAELAGFETLSWQGILAPAGTPRDKVRRLNAEVVKILNAQEIRMRLRNEGSEVVASAPEAFTAFLKSEKTRWSKVIAERGIRGD